MFTGIVEEAGVVKAVEPGKNSIQVGVQTRVCGKALKRGDSLAVNGCCLTVVKKAGRGSNQTVYFDLLQETWTRTNLQFIAPGGLVNLERPLRAGGRLDGHFVTGHVDGVGKIRKWEKVGKDYVLEIDAPPELMRYVVYKGSIAVDGISLTVAKVGKKGFQIWIIPHTFAVTALRERERGDAVNLETDILGKYVESFVGGSKRRR
jgi:riboflavin synthase